MRILSALVLSLSLAACGGSSKSESDMAVMTADMTASTGTLGCFALVECIQKCNGDTTCETNCGAMATTNGQTLLNAVLACSYGVCEQPGDSGTPACSGSSELSAGCQTCANKAANSAACSTQLNACEADLTGL